MGFSKAGVIGFVALTCVWVSAATYNDQSSGKQKGFAIQSVPESDNVRFFNVDNSLHNYEDAVTACQRFAPTSDLALLKGAPTLMDLRMASSADLAAGTYWIKGREAIGAIDPTASWLDNNYQCPNSGTGWSLNGIRIGNSASQPRRCLALVKGSLPGNTYVQSFPCTSRYRALCSMPKDPNFAC